jgi:hypothetical protein
MADLARIAPVYRDAALIACHYVGVGLASRMALETTSRCAGHLGVGMPVRFRFDGREIEIVEIVDQWYGPHYCYFKIKGNDGNLYILRFDEGRVEWELTMFQNPDAASPSCQSLAQCTDRD